VVVLIMKVLNPVVIGGSVSGDIPNHPQGAGDRLAERRSVPRYRMVVDIEVFEPIQRTKLTAQLAEIGSSGCYVRVPAPFQPSTVVQILILKDEKSFKSWGRVAYSRSGEGMGIAFF
jgi:hypothetical protein